MIKHIVVWRFKEDVNKEEKTILIKEKLLELKDKIAEIKMIDVGINFNDSPASADIILISEFETKEDLDLYQKNPIHQAVGTDYIKPYVCERRVVDYEF